MNIKLYGDGIHDDTAAIQTMLDKCGTVRIPEGYYLISRPLIIHSNTHLILDRNATLHLADGANCSLLDNDGLYRDETNENVIIEGGIWDGNNPAQTREYIENENQPCDYDKYIANTLAVSFVRYTVICSGITTVSPFSGFPLVKFAEFSQSQSFFREEDHDVSFANAPVAQSAPTAADTTPLEMNLFIFIPF